MNDMLEKMKKDLKEKGVIKYSSNPKYQSLVEKLIIIRILVRKFDSFEVVEKKLNEMFSDDPSKGIVLSTIHKMKGLESNNVYIYKYDLIPSKYAETVDELYAEKCLAYVAITRAKKRLIFVN